MPITQGGNFSPENTIVSPGVFTRENDLSGIAQGVADIGAVVVAPFAKGPGFSPKLLTNVADLESTFGTADGTYYGPYTAKQYLNEKGFVTVCRIGGLTGYNQQYPLAIYAEPGYYARNGDLGSIVSASSFVNLSSSTALISGSSDYLTGSLSTSTLTSGGTTASYSASVAVSIPSASFIFTFTSSAGTAGVNQVNGPSGSLLFAGSTITTTLSGYTNLGFTGSWTSSVSSIPAANSRALLDYGISNNILTSSGVLQNLTLSGATAPFNGATLISGSIVEYKGSCANPVLRIQGILSGSFGTYTGQFVSYGTSSNDGCGNRTSNYASGSGSAVLLAVLADTSNNSPNTSLVSPGFSGSSLNTASVLNSNSSSILSDYFLSLSGTTKGTYGTYEFSLDPSNTKYIKNVFPTSAVTSLSTTNAYLYTLFEDSIKSIAANPSGYGIKVIALPGAAGSAFDGSSPLNFTDTNSFAPQNGDSNFSLNNANTPYIVSQKIASVNGTTSRYELFQLMTLSDGTNTNTQYKIEISDVRLAGTVPGSDWGTFTLGIRDFTDTDKRPKYLEIFTNLSLDPNSANFVARRIGDRYNYITYSGKIIEYGTYSNVSKYVRVSMATNSYPVSAVPYGFEAYYTPVAGDIAKVTPTLKYSNASLYGTSIGKYPSGVVFNDVPGTDSEIVSLYPTSSTGVPVYHDNLQYFAPLPSGATAGNNVLFALDNTIVGSNTGSVLAASLSGSIPSTVTSLETTYVKMRKFILGFQSGFDGQSPAIKINLGGDIVAGNTQGLDCTNINSAGSVGYKHAVGALGNADEFDINLIVTPGIFHQQHSYVTQLVTDMCEARGDCFYIMDNVVFPSNPQQSVGLIDAAVNDVSTIDSNYVATYYPWVKILDTNINKVVSVPPSVVLPAVYAANDNAAAEWFAPAGLNRGGISQAVQVLDRTTHQERDTLYQGRVNPIASFPGQGICVWGQKTLQQKSSALDRVSVRRLLIGLKKYIASTSKYLVFEQNVASTRNRFLSIVNPYLEGVQQRSGLYAFQVKMDDTNNTPDIIDRNILYGQIYLQPTRTSEFIVLDFNVLPTGATFPNA